MSNRVSLISISIHHQNADLKKYLAVFRLVYYISHHIPQIARCSYRKGYIRYSAQQAEPPLWMCCLRMSRGDMFSGRALQRRSRRRLSARGASRIGHRRGCWRWGFRAVVIRKSESVPSLLCLLRCAILATRLGSQIHELTSLLPRPNPLITGPDSLIGKGGSGESGPATGSRGLDMIMFG